MKLLKTRAELNAELDPLWQAAARISLIPTMGALHEGHLSLARLCGPCDVRVLTIFVNPTQFGPNEDFGRYPRTLEQDVELCDQEGIDFVYAPSVEEMYGGSPKVEIEPGALAEKWEGAIRPGHFRGVLTVVGKFLHQVRPDVAVFGEKDFQQLVIIRAMCEALDWPVEIVAGPTFREADGLAMSSRNRYLKQEERSAATVLVRALQAGQTAIAAGAQSANEVRYVMADVIRKEPMAVADYLTAVSGVTLDEVDVISDETRLIGAVRIGSVRLLDNLPARV